MTARKSREIKAEGKYLRYWDESGWEYVERINCTGIVLIAATTDEDRLLLVEQYRVPLGKNCIELPAGLVGDTAEFAGEPFQQAAERELLEETGYQAVGWTQVAEGPISSGLCSETITIFVAKGLTKVAEGGGDESENIIVHEVPVAELHDWLAQREAEGAAVDPKIFAGLYYLQR